MSDDDDGETAEPGGWDMHSDPLGIVTAGPSGTVELAARPRVRTRMTVWGIPVGHRTCKLDIHEERLHEHDGAHRRTR